MKVKTLGSLKIEAIRNLYVIVPVFMILVIILYGYELLLNYQLKKGLFNDRQIMVKMNDIIKVFGKKVEGSLQAHLCKDKIINHKKVPVNICQKDNCKELRLQLKAKY